MAKEFLPLFLDFNETTQDLSDQQCGHLVRSLVDYANGKEPEIGDGMELMAFRFLKGTIDRNARLSAVRAEAGSKGGFAKAEKQKVANDSKNWQTVANDSKSVNNDNDSNNKTNNDNKTKRFTPPTLQEVTDYCMERGNSVDPSRFIDFYASKGWKVGNQPMKDWKACVRTWEQREVKPVKTVIAQRYDQRDYAGVEDDLARKQNERILKRLQEVG